MAHRRPQTNQKSAPMKIVGGKISTPSDELDAKEWFAIKGRNENRLKNLIGPDGYTKSFEEQKCQK